jgi:hypothetical protein
VLKFIQHKGTFGQMNKEVLGLGPVPVHIHPAPAQELRQLPFSPLSVQAGVSASLP